MLWGTLQNLDLPISDISWEGAISRWFKSIKLFPIYKASDNNDISNSRPISVLPCFSKFLERLVYNRLYKYLKENNILYEKQFGFQGRYSTSDAIVQLVDKTFDFFEKEQLTLGVFIDLSKAFDNLIIQPYRKNWNFMA